MTEGFLCNAMADYGGAVYRLALCRTQSVPDAEDVYHRTYFCAFWTRRRSAGTESG